MVPLQHPSLAPRELIAAYAGGWFPMDTPGDTGPVEMFEADPRGVMPIEGFRVPRSVRRGLQARPYGMPRGRGVRRRRRSVRGAPGRGRLGLTPRLARAYDELNRLGLAHSVEAWRDGRLCGGLFGVALGGLFSSETMFHRAPDAGNAALVGTARLLARAGFSLWDIQVTSDHTSALGARGIAPAEYRRRLRRALDERPGPLG